MTHILVTGSSGQLGHAFQTIADQYPDFRFHFANKNDLDITDHLMTERYLSENSFDYCINCAAYTDVESAEKNPEKAYLVNDLGVENLAVACQLNNTTLVHISTDYVFDGKKDSPYLPSDQPNPINEYGRSKWEGEKKIIKTLTDYYIIRTSWLYSDFGKNFYTTIVRKATENPVLQVTDEQKGCPTHANKLAAYVLNTIIGKSQPYGIYHYTDGEAMTWFSFAKKIIREEGLEDQVRVVRAKNYRTFAKRPINSCLL